MLLQNLSVGSAEVLKYRHCADVWAHSLHVVNTHHTQYITRVVGRPIAVVKTSWRAQVQLFAEGCARIYK